MEQQEIEQAYEAEKLRLTEEYLQKVEQGMPRDRAEAWLKKKLKNARAAYYRDSETELKESRLKRVLKDRFKPLLSFFDRIRRQFE